MPQEASLMGHKFKPTVNQRAQVMRCVADNMRHEQIARRLGIDEETLSNEFSRELKLGLRIMRQMLFAMATRTAIKGNKRVITILARMMKQSSASRRRMPQVAS
jgi:hypothetical protein